MPYTYTYEYPRPALTVDVVLARARPSRSVLLIRRGQEPFKGEWALPGGFVDEFERLEDAARRELFEETAVAWSGPLRQVGTFGDPGRDPRGWTVSVAFVGEASGELDDVEGGDDAEDAAWHDAEHPPALAFDHARILAAALELLP